MSTAIFTINFTTEMTISAIFKAMLNCDVYSLDRESYRNQNKISELLSKQYDKVIFVGTFVVPFLPKLIDKFSNTNFFMYTFGEDYSYTHERLIMFGMREMSPTSFTTYILEKYYDVGNHLKLFRKIFANVLRIIDDRLTQPVSDHEIEVFFTGLHNVNADPDVSLFDNCLKLFLGEDGYELENIMKVGDAVIKAHKKNAQNTVKNNSCLFEIDGIRYAGCAHNSLVHLLHEELVRVYGSEIITFVPMFGLAENGIEFVMAGEKPVLKLSASLSLRNHGNEDVNILEMVKNFKSGGGTESSAGGSVDCIIDFPIRKN